MDNLNPQKPGSQNCLVCRDLLVHFQQFFNMLETTYRPYTSDWMTVDDVASELKVSKSIVYRLIHHCQIEAVNIVDSNSRIPQKGHYRIKRKSLNEYLESKKVKPLPDNSHYISRRRQFPKVKNYLAL
ncbi:MAG: helix-turn-helix domain-containing protein [Planctomycetota bacterium]